MALDRQIVVVMKGQNLNSKVLTICVNYFQADLTVLFAKKLLEQELPFKQQVVIVDNSEYAEADTSDVTLMESLALKHGEITYFHCDQNLGYYGAADFGFNKYLCSEALPEWTIVCNTDISFEGNDFLETLVRKYRIGPPAVIAPAIISQKYGIDQNPYLTGRPSKLRMQEYVLLFRSSALFRCYFFFARIKAKLKRPSINHLYSDGPAKEKSKGIYAPHGAFIVFNKRYFEKGGNFKHEPLLYNEEIHVAETVRQLGLGIVYDPSLRLHHIGHVSTRNLETMRRYKYESAKYCFDRYFK